MPLQPRGANLRSVSPAERCQWSRHLVSRFLRRLGACRTGALVVTAIANLKDAEGNPLYSNNSPATLVVACDKALCRETANGVPSIPLIYTLDNDGPLTQQAAVPSKRCAR